MKYIRALLALSLLSFSLSSMALIKLPANGSSDPFGGPVGPVSPGGSIGGAGGGNGGSVGGVGVSPVGVDLQPVEEQIAVIDLGTPQFGINDVKATTSGLCKVRGIPNPGPWAGSPCEKLYGPTAP